MPAETDLRALLAGIDPILHADEFAWCTVVQTDAALDPICTFREREGVTLILLRADAERRGLSFTFPCRMITLNVQSSLYAVGLLAAVTSMLANAGISVNAVSAYYHDHLFVRSEDAERALAVLLSPTVPR
jgi:uncharacterized protein